MGMMDTLKTAIGMPSTNQKNVEIEGKPYTFTSGKNPSLMSQLKSEPKPIYEPKPPVAKVIGPRKVAEVGSVRG